MTGKDIIKVIVIVVLLAGVILATVAQANNTGWGDSKTVNGSVVTRYSHDIIGLDGSVSIKSISDQPFKLTNEDGRTIRSQPDLNGLGEWATPQFVLKTAPLQSGKWTLLASSDNGVMSIMESDSVVHYRVHSPIGWIWFLVGLAWIIFVLVSYVLDAEVYIAEAAKGFARWLAHDSSEGSIA